MLEDFMITVEEIHRRGMKLIVDMVMNHTSDQHPWFQEARRSVDSPLRDYYVWTKDTDKYKDARIIFVDTERSNWAYSAPTGEYYWHRFYNSQPDLNYDNPEVRRKMMDAIKFWLDLGVDGFRLDAVPYLFEREGTNCENLPETHDFLKELRRFVDENYPGRILLAEANQWPQDLLPYFGDGDELHMCFNFPLMPRLFMALAKAGSHAGDRRDGDDAGNPGELPVGDVPAQPRRADAGDGHAGRSPVHVGFLRARLPLSASIWAFAAAWRRCSTTTTPSSALMHSLLFTLPGAPVLYYGDEIGMGDNVGLPDRNGVRTPMQWEDAIHAGFSNTMSDALYARAAARPDLRLPEGQRRRRRWQTKTRC